MVHRLLIYPAQHSPSVLAPNAIPLRSGRLSSATCASSSLRFGLAALFPLVMQYALRLFSAEMPPRKPEIEKLANNVRSATMRFVLVNDKAPRLPSKCAHCRTPIGARYLRDLSSKLPYCGYACYLVRKTEAVPVVWRFSAGIDGLPIQPL